MFCDYSIQLNSDYWIDLSWMMCILQQLEVGLAFYSNQVCASIDEVVDDI